MMEQNAPNHIIEYCYKYDANDITWGKVFITNNNELKKVLDDETA